MELEEHLPDSLRALLHGELRSGQSIRGWHHGAHRSQSAGRGREFREHRAYVPGDDPRQIDWRAAARHERLVMRQTEAEQQTSLMLLLDRSPAMTYGQRAHNKATISAAIAALLTLVAHRQGDRMGFALGDALDPTTLRAQHSVHHQSRLATALGEGPTLACSWMDVSKDAATELHRHPGADALVIAISDFLDPQIDLDLFLERFGILRAQGHRVLFVQVVHNDELTFPWDDQTLIRFEDLHGCRSPIEGPGSALRGHYLKALMAHLKALEAGCLRRGIHLHRIVADRDDLATRAAELLYSLAQYPGGFAR